MTESASSSNAPHPSPGGRRLLSHGESAVATLGIALAGILLCAMAGSAWWAVHTQREHIFEGNRQQVRALGTTLAQTSEMLLTDGGLSSTRRLLADAARQHDLAALAIVLPDGKIIADAEPSRITLANLPEKWAGPAATQSSESMAADRIELRYPLQVIGRGPAELRLTAQVIQPIGTFWQAQAGVGVIGAAALFAFLLVYRYGRSRMAAMGAIREALLAVRDGDMTPMALGVSDHLGAEAAAWNQLLAEADRIRRDATIDKARELLGPGRRNRTELDDACDAMPHGIILLDEQMRARYANGAAAVFLRTGGDKIVGADVRTLVRDERLKAVLVGWQQPENRRRTIIETQQQSENEQLVLRWVLRPVRREDGGAAMIVIEDVTQQRAADDARTAFVTQATHELRTPLTNIRLYLELAQEEGESDPAMRAKCLNVIGAESRRLERIVSDLLSTAEIEAGSLQVRRDDVRLDELLRQLESDYEAQATEKKLRFTLNLPPKLPVVQGDKDLITLALHNLVGNAVKYTPEGGSVNVNVDIAGEQVVIEVTDTGIGISDEDQGRVFEKFYRANDRRIAHIVGSGLGLALAREVVRLHGGDITLQSELNKGSTFTMSVPLGEAA